MSHAEPSSEPDNLTDATDAMEHALGRVMRSLIRQTQANTPLDEMPIAQVRCLRTISRNEGQKMQDLATLMDATLPAMSQIVERLVKRGMVERRDDPNDRRVVRLHLTPSARIVVEEVRAHRTARVAAAVEHLRAQGNLSQVLQGLQLLAEAAEVTQPASADAADAPLAAGVPADEERAAERVVNGEILDLLSARLYDRRALGGRASEG